MRNAADIQYRENLKMVLINTIERKNNGTDHGRETMNGLKMAIEYLDSLSNEYLSDSEIKHALRLTTYRGRQTDYRALKTA